MNDPFKADALAGKRILVSGGGSGLGREIARGFSAHGATVYICGRREALLAGLSELTREQWAKAKDAIKTSSDRDKKQRSVAEKVATTSAPGAGGETGEAGETGAKKRT